MQMSAMKACFQIAECSLSSAKIRTFSKRAYTWFSEDITIIGDLLSFVLKHFNHIISRLSSTDLCAGHPARGPTSGSEAYLNSASASDSCQ